MGLLRVCKLLPVMKANKNHYDKSPSRFMVKYVPLQLNCNGSNNFGTMKIRSRQGYFELMSVNHSARSGGIIVIYFRVSLT